MKITVSDVLDRHYLEYINYCLPKLRYEQHWSNIGEGVPFFASYVNDEDLFGYEFLLDLLIDKFLENNENIFLNKDIQLSRAYTNCYPYKNSGEWHIDHYNSNAVTILFYPQIWDSKFKGSTLFKNGDSINYVENNAVLFDSSVYHKAEEHFNRLHRYTIAYKILLENTNEK